MVAGTCRSSHSGKGERGTSQLQPLSPIHPFAVRQVWYGWRVWQGLRVYTPPPPCISYTPVQATVAVGTVIILYII